LSLFQENQVMNRIKASLEDPLGLEVAGYAMLDMIPSRRGNLFTDEVYRLTKAHDATTTFPKSINDEGSPSASSRNLPPNHKFTPNDVIMITLQPGGSGDFFSPKTLPIHEDAATVQSRVLNVGPTYIDVAIPAGHLEAYLGSPAPNDLSGRGNPHMRVRIDQFVSDVPYQRMVTALAQTTTARVKPAEETSNPLDRIHMDDLFREVILSTFAFTDPESPFYQQKEACDLQELANKLSKPPMPTSQRLASQTTRYLINKTQTRFPAFNAPQLSAIEAALTRRLTLIQGPPGSGKTTVAAAIGWGFVHQCRAIAPHTKVLACAFSNVGADNLAEALLKVGLSVVRVGKASAVTESLWETTLDAAIDRDPAAKKALELANKATAQLNQVQKSKKGGMLSEDTARQIATKAVKAAIEVSGLLIDRLNDHFVIGDLSSLQYTDSHCS
jgi:AAA domain